MDTHSPPREAAALLDYAGAQAYLGHVSRSTIKSLAAAGQITRVTIGARTMFVRESLDRYVARLQEPREAP